MNSRDAEEAETIEVKDCVEGDGKGKKRFKDKYPDF